jgi:hypothetical protein
MRQTWAMPRREERGSLLTSPMLGAAAVLGLVVASAALLPRGFLLLDTARAPAPVLLPDAPPLAGYLVAAISLFLLGLWVAAHVVKFRSGSARERARATPVWVQVALVVLALLLAGLVSEGRDLFRDDPRPAAEERAPEAPATERDAAGSRALGVALTALLGVLFAALVGGAAWLFWPDRRAPARAVEEDPILEEVDAGIDDLESIRDPREAVISCYARLEAMVERAGIARLESDTPEELMARVLRAHRAADASLSQLTELFARARFSPHRIDDGMRDDALRALRDVRDQLAGAPA